MPPKALGEAAIAEGADPAKMPNAPPSSIMLRSSSMPDSRCCRPSGDFGSNGLSRRFGASLLPQNRRRMAWEPTGLEEPLLSSTRAAFNKSVNFLNRGDLRRGRPESAVRPERAGTAPTRQGALRPPALVAQPALRR